MKSNNAMRELLSETRLSGSLIDSLKNIADDGLEFHEGCYIFSGLPGATNATRSNFTDCTGYECFVNSLHIEDYDAASPFAQAILFVMRVFSVWNSGQPGTHLTAIVSADEFSVATKFHAERYGEQWLSDDIEGYEDPVMSINSDDDLASLLGLR
jgi:hypothetical protein